MSAVVVKALALVCATALPRSDCQPETALDVVTGPAATNGVACMFQTQAFVAHLSRTHPIPEHHYLKVVCTRVKEEMQ